MRSNFEGISFDFDDDYIASPIDESAIDSIEFELNLKFPLEMRKFYMQLNGVQFTENNCCIEQNSGFQKIHSMAELNARNHLLDFVGLYKAGLNPYSPQHLIPFAFDEGGRDFCFSIASDDYGAIYFHDSERTGEPEEIQFLAKDFLSFLAALRPESVFE